VRAPVARACSYEPAANTVGPARHLTGVTDLTDLKNSDLREIPNSRTLGDPVYLHMKMVHVLYFHFRAVPNQFPTVEHCWITTRSKYASSPTGSSVGDGGGEQPQSGGSHEQRISGITS
jgi:hypothetical protein